MSVLNEFLSKAKEVTSESIKKTDQLVKISSLKLTCVQLDNEIKAKYSLLGNRIYDMIKADEENTNELLGLVSEIDILFKRLSETQNKIEDLRHIYACPNCGTKNKIENDYCSKCGKRLSVTDEEFEDYYDFPVE